MSSSAGRSVSKQKAAMDLMDQFARRSGLAVRSSSQQDYPNEKRVPVVKPDGSKRYLWTDAFAVCNYLGFAHDAAARGDERGKARYENLAHNLVESVHQNLGRFRKDDRDSSRRLKWISGLSEEAGAANPTAGGLRIGKENPERAPDDPYDDRAEWHQDGQYFHYLTKWMFALDQMARYTGEPKYNQWAIQLAEKAADSFIYPTGGRAGYRMYWKMSTDLTRPLVLSMGAQDPLDGYVSLLRLSVTANKLRPSGADEKGGDTYPYSLRDRVDRFKLMTKISPTSDTLGIGGMLVDAYRLFKLLREGATVDYHVITELLSDSLVGLRYYLGNGELRESSKYRLAFRELGLSIGLHAIDRMRNDIADKEVEGSLSHLVVGEINSYLEKLVQYIPLSEEIETFWEDPRHQSTTTWTEHIDINQVMLATSLAPDGFLGESFEVS